VQPAHRRDRRQSWRKVSKKTALTNKNICSIIDNAAGAGQGKRYGLPPRLCLFKEKHNGNTQEEIDYFWTALTSGGGEESMCGWLKDKYGLSWQIVPTMMDAMMQGQDPEQLARVTQAMLQMKKLDIAALQRAHAGK
jgi:hypothetical protein